MKSITWLLSFNVIHYSSPLLFSLHLWIHLCLQSDSGAVLSGQSDKLPANNKKKMRDTQHLFIPFFPLSSLCNVIPLFIARPCGSLAGLSCCLGCAPCSFSESIELLQLLSSVFIHCWFSLSIVFHLYVLVSGLIIEVVKLIIRLHYLICGCRMALLW